MKGGEKLNTRNFLASAAFAADETISIKPSDEARFGALTDISVPGIVSGAITMLLVVSALIAFVFLIIGGIKWITSGGDKDRTAGAQKTLTAALVGLVIVFAAWAIIKLIQTFFGIEILELTIPTV